MSREAPPFQPPPRDSRLTEYLAGFPRALFSDRLYRSIELLERYSIDLAIEILAQLGVTEHLVRPASPEELCAELSFVPRFSRVLDWLLRRLIETKIVSARDDEIYSFAFDPWKPELSRLRKIGLEIDLGNAPTLDLLDKAASLYPAIAKAELTGERALFGAEGIPLWLHYFSNENLTYAINNSVAAIAAANHLRDHPRLRILELGAGAGSGTEMLLHYCDQAGLIGKIEYYLITEPNAFFLRRGQRELSQRYPALPLEWRSLDMDIDWQDQKVAPGQFDLVFGVNVLHVAKDLLFSLTEARETLARGGWLVIGECARPFPNQPIYVELIFQLLETFTNVITELEFRPNSGFLTPEQWRSAFTRAGFNRTAVMPEIESIRSFYRHFFTAAICGQAGR
jgi:SAM-dependent methyltransferase